MSNSVYKGKMTVWKDDKGFGFIEPENGTQNVFIHVSALKKMPRRPVAGDIILYQISADKQGKLKAVDAVIEGLKPVIIRRERTSGYKRSEISFKNSVIILMLSILIIFFIVKIIVENTETKTGFNNTNVPQNITKSETVSSSYECQGKTRCHEMTSCDEAMFYLRNCPGVMIDGDGDGIPCEQLCSH